jgi:hypothetical protein
MGRPQAYRPGQDRCGTEARPEFGATGYIAKDAWFQSVADVIKLNGASLLSD